MDWSALLVQHRHWLRKVVLARVGRMDVVEDVLQEVALAAARSTHLPAEPKRISAWLYRVTVLQARLYRRRHHRQLRRTTDYAVIAQQRQNGKGDPEPLVTLLADERRQRIRQAVERLSPREAEILLLKYTEDWSYRQLADHLGIREEAVKSRLHRAREKLRRFVQHLGEHETED